MGEWFHWLKLGLVLTDRNPIGGQILKGKKMAKNENAVAINSELVNDYEVLINADGEREFILKWANAQFNGEISQRDLTASLKEAEAKGQAPSIRAGYGIYFLNARAVLANCENSKAVPVAHLLKVVAVGARNMNRANKEKLGKFKNFASYVEGKPTWAEFEKTARKAEEAVKAIKPPKDKKTPKIEGEVTADSVLSLAYGLFNELEDVTITDFVTAEKFATALAQALKNSRAGQKASKAKHPTNA